MHVTRTQLACRHFDAKLNLVLSVPALEDTPHDISKLWRERQTIAKHTPWGGDGIEKQNAPEHTPGGRCGGTGGDTTHQEVHPPEGGRLRACQAAMHSMSMQAST